MRKMKQMTSEIPLVTINLSNLWFPIPTFFRWNFIKKVL